MDLSLVIGETFENLLIGILASTSAFKYNNINIFLFFCYKYVTKLGTKGSLDNFKVILLTKKSITNFMKELEDLSIIRDSQHLKNYLIKIYLLESIIGICKYLLRKYLTIF